MTVRRKTGSACGKCQTPMPTGARRCMKCGAQIFAAEQLSPAEALRAKRDRILRKYDLTDVQKEILTAAGKGSKEIAVCGTNQQDEGEIKAGDQRFYGNEAVATVAAFVAARLIEPNGEDCFRLTAEGERLIGVLNGEPAAVRG